MSSVINIAPASNIPKMLRELADRIESKEFEPENLTVVFDDEIFSFGQVHGDQAVMNSLWDLEYAKFQIMSCASGRV